MKSKKISIIIPVYNAEQYVEECLLSLKKQNYSNLELIIVNDGSQDDSLSVVRKVTSGMDNVIILDKTNEGVSIARTQGMQHATGDYVMFVDSDDYLLDADALSKIAEIIEKDFDLVLFGAFFEGRGNVGAAHDEHVQDVDHFLTTIILNERLNSPFNKLFKREIIRRNSLGFEGDIKIGEDLLFNLNYLRYCDSIYSMKDIFYFYRTSNSSAATKKFMPTKYEQLMHVNDEMLKIALERGSLKMLNGAKYIRIKNIISCLRDFTHPQCVLDESQKKERARQFKKDNPQIFVHTLGLKAWFAGVVYSYFDIVLLSKVVGKLLGMKS